MALMEIEKPRSAQGVIDEVCQTIVRRATAGSAGICPVELAGAFVSLCAAQSCGKCVPCRIGLAQIGALIDAVLDGDATKADLDVLERTARTAYVSADCAIGYEAGAMVLRSLKGFRHDFEAHVRTGRCEGGPRDAVPCAAGCPAHVDIPGYVSLVGAGRFADAVRLIRKDNPFPLACGLICEHPCELTCRRGVVDDAINIRALKRYAVDHAPEMFAVDDEDEIEGVSTGADTDAADGEGERGSAAASAPYHHPETGKRVAVIGGGPAGLSAAYYLALMGHAPTVFEQREHLGGKMRYGIPAYRFPRSELDREIAWIVSQGIDVRLGITVPNDITLQEMRRDFDAVYIAIGAHDEKTLGLEGENAEGVLSAVEMLRAIGDGFLHHFEGQRIVVVGGGNVAMDVARTSMRLGAESVQVVYRRRVEDMTAQAEEIEGAIAEGCEICELMAPVRIVTEDERVVGLEVQPQVIGAVDHGRPKPVKAARPTEVIPCDRVLMAVGQAVGAAALDAGDLPVEWGRIVAGPFGQVPGVEGVFAGGDCETGPATVISAIAAGKAAARNIDEFLGFDHIISVDVDIPPACAADRAPCGRSNTMERSAQDRMADFAMMEHGLTAQEAIQESGRCLRCDRFGLGALGGGRTFSW